MLLDKNRLSVLPAFLNVKGKSVMVVGSGLGALSRLRFLFKTSAFVMLVAQDPEPPLSAYLRKIIFLGRVKWVDASFDKSMLDGIFLVFSAIGEISQDRVIANAANQARVPVNVLDFPDLCDFFIPAFVNRAPITVAIGSEGTSPVLTQILRSRIDALLSPELGKLARFAHRFRKIVGKYLIKGAVRRRFWHDFFSGSVANAIFSGDERKAERCALQLLDSNRKIHNFPLRFLNVSHGMAEFLTMASQRALMEADVVIYDHGVSSEILSTIRRDAVLSSAPSKLFFLINLIKESSKLNTQVLRLVVDERRFAEEVNVLTTCGIAFEIIPSFIGKMLSKNEV
ncbi:MAG: uroporphyrin-III C-methyltransferase / precorrin-2 dehydrogenase / sirohydrochlorin ferrochelatase [Candidatus Tokpelaia sp. JSC161]|jgi:uroporphyrin-III C-methyltransferase/precorrin-2 dehydrogenase/sirohydrochlorin ferrochelatase|nr:MAG: uroporphyrin-III C-methyltransferase / precorrin-2 dehydrogenase / sirohydrochlorin ferrochelatase [Candidatus Tokpelaia sp. JSC161]